MPRAEDVLPVEYDLAFRALARVKVVHPVQNAKERRFSAAGRADKGCNLTVVNRHVDVLERLGLPVEEVKITDLDPRFAAIGSAICQLVHHFTLEELSQRAITLSVRTAKVIRRAPVHAKSCHLS